MTATAWAARGESPANKGRRYPPDPPRVEEIITVMRAAGDRAHGLRLRALIVVLWRAGLRIGEALALAESDLEPAQGSVLVRSGKGGRRRVVEWTSGAGVNCDLGLSSPRPPRRAALLRDQPADHRSAVVELGGTPSLPPVGGERRG